MGKETDKKYKVMKTIMDALEDILCSYQGRGHLSAYTDLDSLALFASFVAYGQIQVENYQYDYDDDIREDREAVRIYQELAPQTRWRVGQHTQIELIRMNALKQFAVMGTPVFQEQIYYKDTASVLVCGEILPYEVFQLFTGTVEVERLYIFPYPFRDGWEKPLYFSFVPTETALEEMRRYEERKWEEMCRTIREKDKSFDTIIPKVEMWEG